jgi:FkbM family methyltransferase
MRFLFGRNPQLDSLAKSLIHLGHRVFYENTEPSYEYIVTDCIDGLENISFYKLVYFGKEPIQGEKVIHGDITLDAPTFLEKIRPELKIHLQKLAEATLPENHVAYLKKLKASGFEPKVIYDIGSCVLFWTKAAKEVWPNATYILFDAYMELECLYKGYDYHMGVLSDKEEEVKFYQNEYYPGGNSYYREIGSSAADYFFPENNYILKQSSTLDKVVKERGFPLPDFVKIDVQGCEVDIIKGGKETLQHASRMIVELQHVEYNRGAFKSTESLPIIESYGFNCVDPLFTNAGPDGDYGFINSKRV